MFVSCFFVCCVGSGLCDRLITRTEGVVPGVSLYACLILCHLGTSPVRRPKPGGGCYTTERNLYKSVVKLRNTRIIQKVSSVGLLRKKNKNTEWPKKCIHSLLINIFGINLNEISISG